VNGRIAHTCSITELLKTRANVASRDETADTRPSPATQDRGAGQVVFRSGFVVLYEQKSQPGRPCEQRLPAVTGVSQCQNPRLVSDDEF